MDPQGTYSDKNPTHQKEEATDHVVSSHTVHSYLRSTTCNINRRLAVTVHPKRPILSTLEFRLAFFTPGIDGFVTIFGGMNDSLDRPCHLHSGAEFHIKAAIHHHLGQL